MYKSWIIYATNRKPPQGWNHWMKSNSPFTKWMEDGHVSLSANVRSIFVEYL